MPCVDATADLATATPQLWSIELGESSSELHYLRNVCTDLVIRKIKPACDDKHALIAGYCKNDFHFDLDLVSRDNCLDPEKFGVNDCVWNVVGDLAILI